MSKDVASMAPSAEQARCVPVTRDGHDFRRYYFSGLRAHALIGPRLVSQPNAAGDDWELAAEAPDSLAEITSMSVVNAPRHTGLNLYRAAMLGVNEMGYTHLAARVHNARVLKIMQRLHTGRVLLLPKDLRRNADVKKHHAFEQAWSGAYGEGVSLTEAIAFLSEGAPEDGYMSARCVDAFIDVTERKEHSE